MKKKKILSITKKDFKISAFKSGGPGGQHQNKTDSGVRITHIESGAVGESRTHKSQHANKKLAFHRLTESKEFKLWLNRRIFEIGDGMTIEEKVEKQMDPKNLNIEIKDDRGRWSKCTKTL